MQHRNYTTTSLEDYIQTIYTKMQIKTARDINITRIARHHSIFIHYKQLPSRYDVFHRYRAINLDARISPDKQREDFFHELCHILRHVGRQSMMPEAFRELQEWDAKRFTMHAALPYFMLKNYDLDNPTLIPDLASEFKVTEKLIKKKLNYIKRNTQPDLLLVAEPKELYN